MRKGLSPEEVARCCVLGMLLELSTTPKPGLVDRTSNLTLYIQFTTSAIALYKHFKDAASGEDLGKTVKEACKSMLSWQSGGNTYLGAILLLMPLAKAAGKCDKFGKLRSVLKKLLRSLDYHVTLDYFEAIRLVSPGHLGRVAYLDVNLNKTDRIISRKRIGLVDALKPYVGKEVVATEYITGYENSFIHGYYYLRKLLGVTDLNDAGVNTFLNILKNLPDSHVRRMYGLPAARALSRMAGKVLNAGGTLTDEGRRRMDVLARKIVKAGYKPAATADILSVSYTLLLLSGWRP